MSGGAGERTRLPACTGPAGDRRPQLIGVPWDFSEILGRGLNLLKPNVGCGLELFYSVSKRIVTSQLPADLGTFRLH